MERIEIRRRKKHPLFLPQPKPSGRIVAEFETSRKSYGSKEVLS